MVTDGSKGEYTTAFLQKEFKKLAAAAEKASIGGNHTVNTDDNHKTKDSDSSVNLPAGVGGVAVKSEDADGGDEI